MKKSFLNQDYCPNCENKNAGGLLTILTLGTLFSWKCPHCGALVRMNYLLFFIYEMFGLGLFPICATPRKLIKKTTNFL